MLGDDTPEKDYFENKLLNGIFFLFLYNFLFLDYMDATKGGKKDALRVCLSRGLGKEVHMVKNWMFFWILLSHYSFRKFILDFRDAEK